MSEIVTAHCDVMSTTRHNRAPRLDDHRLRPLSIVVFSGGAFTVTTPDKPMGGRDSKGGGENKAITKPDMMGR
jgi:hypothetical protein